MNESDSAAAWRRSTEIARATIRASEHFEDAWHAGEKPAIEQFTAGLDPETHAIVIAELQALAAELQARANNPASDPAESANARQLLLGLLAHEHGLIDRRLLLAGYQHWTKQPGKSLGTILVDRRAITPGRLAAIEELVQAYVSKHGNSTRQALRSLRSPDSLRLELEELSSPACRAELAYLGLDNIPYVERSAFESVGPRYKILQPLNQGGMGRVSVAIDAVMHRKVALKEIREEAADDLLYRTRFLTEAELTGRLEHPGIIPVYSTGQRSDGRPFYAMRLIHGEKTGTLKAAIDNFYAQNHGNAADREVAFRGLLNRVLDVCNTIAYAHSQSVIHRDLKPSNILLGPYGETLVVDWGLAKVLGRQDTNNATAKVGPSHASEPIGPADSTVLGDTIGTPEYAAPEQIAGNLASIGPASDVYALGSILYYLLTGKSAFDRRGADTETFKQQILKGEFPTPRQIRPAADPSLEAICLKAMQTRPADRYPSAQALERDLERYLAGEPVTVYQEPVLVRSRRWIARHRVLAASSFVALLAAVLGLAATSAVQIRARTNMDLKNQELAAQRRTAEDRESLAIEAVKQFREAVANDPTLKNSATLASLRTRLLQKPLFFFQNLQEELEQSQDRQPASLVRIGEASSEHARLLEELGDYQRAINLQERSIALYRQAIQDTKDPSLSWSMAQADVEFRRATLFRKLGDNDSALDGFRHAVEMNHKLLDAFPDNLDIQAQTASADNSLGTMLARLGRTAEARPILEKALAMRVNLNQARPGQKDILIALTGSHYNLGLLLSELGQLQKSLTEIDKAIAIYRDLAKQDPSDPEIQSSLETCLFHRGIKLFEAGKTSDGLVEMEKALALRVKLVQDYPAITEYKYGLLQNYSKLTMKYKQSGQTERAFNTQQPAIQVAEELVKQSPDTPRFLSGLMEQQHENGHLLILLNRPHEAMKAFDQALATHAKLVAFSQPDARLLYNHAELLKHLPELYQNTGDLKSAQSWMKQAIAAYKVLTAAGGFPGKPLPPLRQYLQDLKDISEELGDTETAAEARRQQAELPPEQN